MENTIQRLNRYFLCFTAVCRFVSNAAGVPFPELALNDVVNVWWPHICWNNHKSNDTDILNW